MLTNRFVRSDTGLTVIQSCMTENQSWNCQRSHSTETRVAFVKLVLKPQAPDLTHDIHLNCVAFSEFVIGFLPTTTTQQDDWHQSTIIVTVNIDIKLDTVFWPCLANPNHTSYS